MNLIAFGYLEPYHYQKVLDGYEVVYLDWSYKDLYAIDMYINLIDKLRGLVKYSAPTGATISSVSECRRKTTTPPPIVQAEKSFSLIHNILW